jgi:1,2-dihydroxy-3-keto-5-methylthiopentene dioxygenase
MTLLHVMPEDDAGTVLLRTDDPGRISAELAPLRVSLDRWALVRPRGPDVLADYDAQVAQLRECGGFRLVDVASVRPDEADPEWPARARAAREKFLAEHCHDEDEVRFFAAGRGCFYLHAGTLVHAVACEAGDLIAVPRGTRHWFDMGSVPDFVAIRFFQREDGWIGAFTGSPIASRFPSLDELAAS